MAELEEHAHYKAYTQAFRIGSPIVICVGVIGNILSLIILRSKFFRNVPSSVGFTLLAIVDICILTIGFLPSWIGNITDGKHEIRGMGQVGCKSHIFLTYLFAFLGPWTLVLITIERLISVVNPTAHSSICTTRNIFIGWLVIVVVLFGANLHFIWTYELIRSSNIITADIIYDCQYHSNHLDFHNDIWPWVDFSVSFAGPFLVILVCNMAIIIVVCLNRRRYSNLPGKQVSQLDKITSTTAMSVSVSVIYLLTTSPVVIVGLLLSYGKITMDTIPQTASAYLILILVNLVFYINSAINFLLYFMTNAHFRAAAKHLLCCQCYSPDMGDGDSRGSWESGRPGQQSGMPMGQYQEDKHKY